MKLDVLFVSILIVFGTFILVLVGLVLRNKVKTSEIRVLGFLLGVNTLYIIGYALELSASSLELKLIFNHVQYSGLPFIAPLWLMMCRRFYRKRHAAHWLMTVMLFVLPAVTLVLNLTHTVNGLYYSSFQMVKWDGFDVLVFTKGPWYYVENVYKTTLLAVSVGLYTVTFFRSSGIRKKQSASLLALSVIGFLLSASSVINTTTATIDFMCILLSASMILIAVSVYKYELFGLMPLAYSRLFDVLDQPIFVLSESGTIIRANTKASQVFTAAMDVRKKQMLSDIFDSEGDNANLTRTETKLYRKTGNGQDRYYTVNMISLDPESSDSARGYLAVLTDTTSHIEQIRSLETLAAGDPLTGLFNRRHFFTASGKIFAAANASEQPVSLVVFDIDHFKGINDVFGHQAGDYVLRSVAEAISHQLRSDDVLARFGGDEFVLMLGAADTDTALTVASRICASVHNTEYEFDGNRIKLTLSAGIGGGKAPQFKDLDELMSLADNALYDAKSTGRNRVCVSKKCKKKADISQPS